MPNPPTPGTRPAAARCLARLVPVLALGTGLLLAGGSATAGITPLGEHSSAVSGGPSPATPWQYDRALLRSPASVEVVPPAASHHAAAGHLLLAGSSFTPFGFDGDVDQSCLAPTGWGCVASQLSLSEAEALADGSAERLVSRDAFKLTETDAGAPSSGTVRGLALARFSGESVGSSAGPLNWSASGLAADPSAGRPGDTPPWLHSGTIAGPGWLALGIPEPSTLALSALAMALVGLGLASREPPPDTNAAD